MDKIINFIKKNKYIIFIFIIILICSIAISVAIYSDVTNKKIIKREEKEYNNSDTIKNNFNNIFTSTENEYIYNGYNIETQENGKYSINVKIPYLKIESEKAKDINSEIDEIFVEKLKQIANRYNTICNL